MGRSLPSPAPQEPILPGMASRKSRQMLRPAKCTITDLPFPSPFVSATAMAGALRWQNNLPSVDIGASNDLARYYAIMLSRCFPGARLCQRCAGCLVES